MQIATLEFALLDLLGNIADKPAGQLLGDLLNPDVSIYLGHHYGNLRKLEPEVSLELKLVESKAEPFESTKGVIKVPTGSGMGVTIDPDYIQTHTLVSS